MTKPITIHLLSDSLGETADAVARAAAAQFPPGTFRLERLPKVESPSSLRAGRLALRRDCIFFYTLAEGPLRDEMERCIQERGVKAVDILGPASSCSRGSGLTPRRSSAPSACRRGVLDRIEAMEFAIKHDDGRSPRGCSRPTSS